MTTHEPPITYVATVQWRNEHSFAVDVIGVYLKLDAAKTACHNHASDRHWDEIEWRWEGCLPHVLSAGYEYFFEIFKMS